MANSADNLGNQYDGRIYDMQIYNGVLNQPEAAGLYLNPGSFYYAEMPAFPGLEENVMGPELIPNGDFASMANNVDNPATQSNLWYVTGSKGDLWELYEGYADLVDWSFYYEDPDNITPLVGTAGAEDADTDTYPLDGTILLDTWINGENVILSSANSYRNGMKSEDILNGASINPAGTYKFELSGWAQVDSANATVTAALTTGTDATNTANAVAGSLIQAPIADLSDTLSVELNGADLTGGQFNVMFHVENTDPIPGVADENNELIRANYRSTPPNSQAWFSSISLHEIIVPEEGDFNRDGVVDQLDVDLANSYLDGTVDYGPTAAERQAEKTLAELNLTAFDLDSDGDFDADDVTELESLIIPAGPLVIQSAVMNGSVFEVQVSGLVSGSTYYLKRDVDLTAAPEFDLTVDTVIPDSGSDTATLTDTDPPVGKAFYKVTD